jgi:protein-L-isoaspartate O-methyltransferase
MLDLDAMRALLERGEGRDRAFVDAMIRMRWSRARAPAERDELSELHAALRAAAIRSQAAIREEIASGALRGAPLRRRFEAVPTGERDHFVEEVLGIAYPPLDEPVLPPELIGYQPSGYDEIVHAFDATRLAPGDRLLDVGSGAGKVVMLATLLAGATSYGIERDGALVKIAEDACRDLRIAEAVCFARADAREVPVEDADVVFMYLPFSGKTLATFVNGVMERGRRSPRRARGRFLCAGPLDLSRYRDLVAGGPPRSWLHIYAWR